MLYSSINVYEIYDRQWNQKSETTTCGSCALMSPKIMTNLLCGVISLDFTLIRWLKLDISVQLIG